MGIKVYGSLMSTCTATVLAVIEELNLEYEFIHVNLTTGEHKQQPYIKRNPFRKIPALEDGDLVLFESRAITRYLVQKYGKGSDLLKEDTTVDAAIVNQWIEVESQHFNGPISAIVFQYVVLPLLGGKTDEKAAATEAEKLGKVLDVYEAQLSQTKFLAGEFYSLADLHHISYSHYLISDTPHGSLIHSRPHVKAWWEAISSRPASKKVTASLAISI